MIDFSKFYFQKKNVLTRLGIVRIIFSIIIIQFTLNDEEALAFNSFLEQHFFTHTVWYSTILPHWTNLIVVLAFFHLIGFYQEYLKWLLAITFIPFTYYFNFHLDSVSPAIWSYTTNLPFFMFALLFSNNEAFSIDRFFRKKPYAQDENINSFILRFFQIYILTMFFQSAVSKAMISGKDWFLDEKIMYFHIALQGTDFGKSLLDSEFAITLTGFLTGVFELFGVVLFYFSKQLYAISALLFHFGAWLILDIDFYFLYPLYAPIFFDLEWLEQIRIKLNMKKVPEAPKHYVS